MTRYVRRPLTLAELWQDGPPCRVRDLMHITGWSRDSIIASIESGDLQVLRRNDRAVYTITRAKARQWLVKVGVEQVA